MTDRRDPDGDRDESPFSVERRGSVLALERPGTEWLSTGWNGGRWRVSRAYNVSVPEGWRPWIIGPDVERRLASAGFEESGPTLLTGVDMRHARAARCGPVIVVATAGVSNPAALPADPAGGDLLADQPAVERRDDHSRDESPPAPSTDTAIDDNVDGEEPKRGGTVNLLVGTSLTLSEGALANLLTVVGEAKATTLLARTGFPGTTTDAVVVGHDPTGDPVAFSGSATRVGAATRACVREAVTAALDARYGPRTDESVPESVNDAQYGTSTDVRAAVFEPADRIDPDGVERRE